MALIAYVNGCYVPAPAAQVSAQDRGFQFADSVYEVMDLRGGALMDARGHLDRLEHSLGALGIPAPMTRPALEIVLREVARRSRLREGAVYVQVTRGAALRSFAIPEPALRPTLVALPIRLNAQRLEAARRDGKAVVTMRDQRWARRDIKTTALLPACLALARARERGADDAWLVGPEGTVTEGTSSNAWIVEAGGGLRTRPAREGAILKGVTREAVLGIAAEMGLAVRLEAFTPGEARAAAEAFSTSAGARIVPVVRIDGHAVGQGGPGPVTREIARRYEAYVTPPQRAQNGWGP